MAMESPRKAPAPTNAQRRQRRPSDELVPLQFRMPPEFVRKFKLEALNRGMKLNQFFEFCFNHLRKS